MSNLKNFSIFFFFFGNRVIKFFMIFFLLDINGNLLIFFFIGFFIVIFKYVIGDLMKGKVSKFLFVFNKEKIIENLIIRFSKEKEGIEKFFKLFKVGFKVLKFLY